MLTGNVHRTKVGAGTGPPPFVPFKETGMSTSKKGSAEVRSVGQAKKPSSSGYPSKSSGASRSQHNIQPRPSTSSSRSSQREQGRGDKPSSESGGRTYSTERDKRDIDFKRSSKGARGQSVGEWRDRSREKEFEGKHQVASKGQQQIYQEKRTTESSAKGRGSGGREFIEPQRSGSHEEFQRGRGRREGRGRGRGQREPDDYRYSPAPVMGDRYEHRVDLEMQRPRELGHEGGRRGRGRGRGRGRRGRNYDDDDDYHQPSSRPTAGHSLADWFDQKLVLKDAPPRSSHFGWYEEDYDDYYYERDHPHMYEERGEYGGFARYNDYREDRPSTKQKSKAKVACEEEDYPPMPTKSTSDSQITTGSNVEESHWDWVGLAAGSGAPSTATKK